MSPATEEAPYTDRHRPPAASPARPGASRHLPRVRPRRVAVFIALVAVAITAGAARFFNQTYDEGAHLAAGVQWFRQGSYTYDPQHPPLARIAIALGPVLGGARPHHRSTVWDEGNAILVAGNHYERTLARARAGVLPFLVLLLAVVWAWTRHLYGEPAAVVAVLLTATTPQILAHGGLATTDLPLAATLSWALYAFARWLERAPPTARRTLTFGVAGGAAMVAKLSSLPFFALAALLILLARWLVGERPDGAVEESTARRRRWSWSTIGAYVRPALAAALTAGLVVWATYRFHVVLARGFIPVPAPEFLDGIRHVIAHNRGGHAAYLFGTVRQFGWWYYPVVAFAMKTPLATLSLAAIGVGAVVQGLRRHTADWRHLTPVVAALAILLVAMTASIDLGVRYLLPLYPLLTIPAAGAVAALWSTAPRRTLTRGVLAALVGWQAVRVARVYPDFLADTNVLAGRHPERTLVDSNLDWGQDLQRLADTLAARRITSVSLFYFGSTPVGAVHVADTVRIGGEAPATGWVAVSQTYLQGVYVDCFTWLRQYTPVARIGRSILLYRLLPDTAPRLPSGTVAITSPTEPYGAVLGTPDRHTTLCKQPRALLHGGLTALDPSDGTESAGSTLLARARSAFNALLPDAAAADESTGTVAPISSLVLPPAPLPVTDAMLLAAESDARNWLTYGHDYTNRRYSPLTQVDRSNVHRLATAWVHQLETPPGGQESSPLVVDGVLYYTGPFGVIVAVDARTGVELWRYQHKLAPVPTCCGAKNRGVAVYHDKVYLATLDDHLLAIDRRTGTLVWDVEVANPEVGYSMTSAPLAVDGKVVVGVGGSEFPIRGFLDAYDAETGAHVWRFWTVPSPEEGGWWGKWSQTTPDGDRLPRDLAREKRDSARYAEAWRTGGGGVWNTPSFDPELQLLFFGVGNPAPNMDASVRPGDNLYTTSIVAVDVNTGKLRWYYQEVPHDEWDYDAASPTVLFDLTVDGKRVPAVAQAGKTGWVYILDRRTGARIRRTSEFVPHENTFARPTPKGVRIMPGMGGGSNWTPPAYSPRTGLIYVSGTVEPILFVLSPERMEPGVKWQGGRHVPLAPAQGTFTAIDVSTGKIRWQKWTRERMLGTGALATAGDLVFYGEREGIFHAADARTGEVLWSARIGGRLRAPPISYEVDGRQYVAVISGGALFAFALPE